MAVLLIASRLRHTPNSPHFPRYNWAEEKAFTI
jgi:hypothetical protein